MKPDLTQKVTVEDLDAEWEKNQWVYFWRLRHHYLLVAEYLSGKVLDIGCGPGYLAAFVKPNAHWYWGIDISPEAIRQAQILFPESHFLTGDVESEPLPYGDNEFDTVVVSEVFEHLEDHAPLIKEVRRVTKEFVVVTTPISMGGVGHIWPRWRYSNILHLAQRLGHVIEIRRAFEIRTNLAYVRTNGHPKPMEFYE